MAMDARKRAKAAMVKSAQARVFAARQAVPTMEADPLDGMEVFAPPVPIPARENGGPIDGPHSLNDLRCSACGVECKKSAKGVTIGRCRKKFGGEAVCDMVIIGGSSTP